MGRNLIIVYILAVIRLKKAVIMISKLKQKPKGKKKQTNFNKLRKLFIGEKSGESNNSMSFVLAECSKTDTENEQVQIIKSGNNIKSLYSEEELSELEINASMVKGTSYNGNKVICYDIMKKIISDEISIFEVSKDELLTVYYQLKVYSDNFKGIVPFLDTRVLDTFNNKSRKIIYDEICRRRKEKSQSAS